MNSYQFLNAVEAINNMELLIAPVLVYLGYKIGKVNDAHEQQVSTQKQEEEVTQLKQAVEQIKKESEEAIVEFTVKLTRQKIVIGALATGLTGMLRNMHNSQMFDEKN